MRLLLYKLLTQTIIILGRLRDNLKLRTVIRRDRTFKNPDDILFSIDCCDCGLIHMRLAEDGLEQPLRPENYDYSWRNFAGPSAEFRHEDEWVDILDEKGMEVNGI